MWRTCRRSFESVPKLYLYTTVVFFYAVQFTRIFIVLTTGGKPVFYGATPIQVGAIIGS